MKAGLTSLRLLVVAAVCLPVIANADVPEYKLVIKDHRFIPAELKIPAGQKVVLIVDNQDASAEEFESHDLELEKVIPGNTSAKIQVLPQDPGRYNFFGEFHEDETKGVLIVE